MIKPWRIREDHGSRSVSECVCSRLELFADSLIMTAAHGLSSWPAKIIANAAWCRYVQYTFLWLPQFMQASLTLTS